MEKRFPTREQAESYARLGSVMVDGDAIKNMYEEMDRVQSVSDRKSESLVMMNQNEDTMRDLIRDMAVAMKSKLIDRGGSWPRCVSCRKGGVGHSVAGKGMRWDTSEHEPNCEWQALIRQADKYLASEEDPK